MAIICVSVYGSPLICGFMLVKFSAKATDENFKQKKKKYW